MALLNRGNTSSGSYVFEMAGATDVTLDHLRITGATIGVVAGNGAASTHLTVSNSTIYSNTQDGIFLDRLQ